MIEFCGSGLPEQIHISLNQKLKMSVTPVQNVEMFVKPKGGFWTSSINEDGTTCSWIEAAADMGVLHPRFHTHILTPKPEARILRIDSLKDLRQALASYPTEYAIKSVSRFIAALDFEAISKDYDAMHLTDKGQSATRLTRPSLNGWDCESTLWFRWAFVSCQWIELQRPMKTVEVKSNGTR